jgi:polyribonucleotide nucleotidyltransferase
MAETTIETGRLAKQADGSVVVRIGKTVIGTVVSSRKASPVDFLPLTVDYRENLQQRTFSWRFLQREARPSDNEVTMK